MPKMKQMVKRMEVEIAQRQRTCKFSNAKIPQGDPCIVLYESPRDRFCYSRPTAIAMIKLARARLDELELELTSPH